MSIVPFVTFRAGRCEGESGPFRCLPTPGYIYVYTGAEDELLHFCWRPRSSPASEPEVDLIMFPGDASFVPYKDARNATTPSASSPSSAAVKSPTTGRIFVLKFQSSSQRYLFWLQSATGTAAANTFSARDLKIGSIINRLWAGDDVDVETEMRELAGGAPRHDADGDDDMHDPDADVNGGEGEGGGSLANSTGGAGADATGGDVREEGEEAREGGADGARAGHAALGDISTEADTAALVRSLIASLNQESGGGTGTSTGARTRRQPPENVFTTLVDLLAPETSVAVVASAPTALLDALLAQLPAAALLPDPGSSSSSSSSATTTAASSASAGGPVTAATLSALSAAQKRAALVRVLRSPQFHQSLGVLTAALRDGGLPTVAAALGVRVENGGYVPGGTVPLGGGDAVEAFVKGVERAVVDEDKEKKSEVEGEGEKMDTS